MLRNFRSAKLRRTHLPGLCEHESASLSTAISGTLSRRAMTAGNTSMKATFIGNVATNQGATPRSAQGKLHLLTMSTPNGQKVQIALEELRQQYGDRIDWSWDWIGIMHNTQKEPWYLKVNPNGKIPVLIDNTIEGGFPVFESAAILLWLGEKWDADHIFGFEGEEERSQVIQWISFSQGGIGPMQGQLGHFTGLGERIPYAIDRFSNECKRLYGVVEGRLSGTFTGDSSRDYLVGQGRGKYSWADIHAYPWISAHQRSGISHTEFESQFPQTNTWLKRIAARTAVQIGTQGYGKPAL